MSESMNEEAKEARRAYLAQYREKNRERIRAYDKAWREKNPDKVKAKAHRYWVHKSQREKDAAVQTGKAE